MVNIISNRRARRLHPGTGASGFSLIELLVVLGIIAIITGISIPYLYNYRKLYRSEDQALKVMDLMREASQLGLNRRRTIRLEIDLTDNAVLIIDENGANPDTLIKLIPLDSTSEVRIDAQPSGVTPPSPPDYAAAVFATDAIGHFSGSVNITGHNVFAARFKSDGSVVNAANTPISATIFSWAPKTAGDSVPRAKQEVRAITMFGGSGAVRYWRHNGTTFVAY